MSYKNREAKIEDKKKMIKYAKSEPSEVLFRKVGEFKDLKILAVSDGAYLRLENKTKSEAGNDFLIQPK